MPSKHKSSTVNPAWRESEAHLRLMIDDLPTLIRMSDAGGFCFFVNKSWLAFTGRALEQELGDGWSEGMPRDDYARYRLAYEKALASRHPFEMRYRLRHRSGEYRWLLEKGAPSHEPDGSFAGYSVVCDDAGEYAPSEQDGQQSQSLYPAIVEAVPHILFSLLPDGRAEYINRAWNEYTGLPDECSREHGWQNALHADERERLLTEWREHIETGAAFVIEHRLRSAGGAYRWFLSRIGPIRDASGRIVRWIGTATDVHERQQAEQALRGNLTLQSAILDSAAYIIVATDPAGVILTFNRAAEKLLGYAREEVVGKATPLLFHDAAEIQRCAEDLTDRLGRTVPAGFEVLSLKARLGLLNDKEWTLVKKDGSRFTVELSATVLRDAQGVMSGFLCIAGDISERKRTADLLASQQFMLQAIALGWPLKEVLQIITGAMTKQFSGAYCTARQAGEREAVFSGITSDQSACAFVANGRVCSPDARLCDQAKQVSRSFVVRDIARDPLCAHVREMALSRGFRGCWSHPIVGQSGEVLGTLSVYQRSVREPSARDLETLRMATQLSGIAMEHRRAEQQLRDRADALVRLNQELSRRNAELDAFAHSASHDLKEPLRGIHNYAQFLLEDYAGIIDTEGVAKLQTLTRLTQRMEALINSLLHFSRLGRHALRLRATCLQDVLEETLEMLAVLIDESGAQIRIPQPLPTQVVDRALVGELFANLIANAIKYNDQAERWIEIGYREPPSEYPKAAAAWQFYVKDNGIGIPQQYHEAIFHIFKRLHGRDQYGGGTGAGLSIAKRIVERHGGRIWVESAPGEGSTFWFTLDDAAGDADPA